MELFEVINGSLLDEESLKKFLVIERLPDLCKSINTVISADKDSGVIYCVWGEHKINREIIKHGVSFSLPECPSALLWSVTIQEGNAENNIIIHCTTNNEEKDEEFIDSIREFATDCAPVVKAS